MMCFGHASAIIFEGFDDDNYDDLVGDFDVKIMANLIGIPLTYGCFQCRRVIQLSARAITASETKLSQGATEASKGTSAKLLYLVPVLCEILQHPVEV